MIDSIDRIFDGTPVVYHTKENLPDIYGKIELFRAFLASRLTMITGFWLRPMN